MFHEVSGSDKSTQCVYIFGKQIQMHSRKRQQNKKKSFVQHSTLPVYIRVPQIISWRANLLQSLAPTLIKLTYL